MARCTRWLWRWPALSCHSQGAHAGERPWADPPPATHTPAPRREFLARGWGMLVTPGKCIGNHLDSQGVVQISSPARLRECDQEVCKAHPDQAIRSQTKGHAIEVFCGQLDRSSTNFQGLTSGCCSGYSTSSRMSCSTASMPPKSV